MRIAILLSVVAAIIFAGYMLMYYEKNRREEKSLESELAQIDNEFNKRISEIAREYLDYKLVKPDLKFAPTLCRAPKPTARIFASESLDADSHGNKLYYLFARNQKAYENAASRPSPVGQVIVKESWKAVPMGINDHVANARHASGEPVMTSTSRGGQAYRAGEQTDLFVMYKMAEDTPGTDRGWVYGVASPDGARIRAAGKLDNCMACHRDAGADRLFGSPTD